MAVSLWLAWRVFPESARHASRSWLTGPAVDLAARGRPSDRFVANLPWFGYGWDFGRVEAWNSQGVSGRRAEVEAQLRALKAGGVNTVAWFLFGDGRGAPSFDQAGLPTGLGSAFWADYDAALEICRRLDVGVLWVLVDQQWFYPERVEGKNGTRVRLAGNAPVVESAAGRRALLEQVLGPLVRRYPHERQIVGWVLVNEPDNVMDKGAISIASMVSLVREAADLIHGSTYRQPVSLAFNDLQALAKAAPSGLLDKLDFLIFHHYADNLPPPADEVRARLGVGDKPLYIGEYDVCLTGAEPGPSRLERWIRWTTLLGYDGVWPWSVREAAVGSTCKTDAATRMAEEVGQREQGLGALSDRFRARRGMPKLALDRLDVAWGDWIREGNAVMAAETAEAGRVLQDVQELERERVARLADLEKDRRELFEDIPRCIAGAEARKSTARMTGERACLSAERAARSRVEVAAADAALALCEQWQEASRSDLDQAGRRLRDIAADLVDIEKRRWRVRLYLDFWSRELAWAGQVGLTGSPAVTAPTAVESGLVGPAPGRQP